MVKKYITCDGNTAAAKIAYAFSEVAAIYPITPSSSMGEMADEWSAKNKKNLFGQTVIVSEMQSEGGAAGAIHGSLSAGALTTTFTASQGLLLMLPNMFKIAGEMMPTVFHVASRSLAYQSLSIFCDHSDVMATRGTGFAITCASNVQEVQDMAVISHLSTLKSKVPFLSFFDGFRTSSVVQKIEDIDEDTLKSMIEMKYIEQFRRAALSPERPYAKVGAENPDVYFQGRETVNIFYDKTPEIVKEYMKLFEEKTGRKYQLFDYVGTENPEKIIIAMGSSTDTIEETINYLNMKGENVGLIKIRLYRPFYAKDFIESIPSSVKKIAVLDRTKEAGSVGEPLYLDVVTAIANYRQENPESCKLSTDLLILGGRYGLSSKEFTPSMVKGVFDHLDKNGHNNFTVGINDDVTHKSIIVKNHINVEQIGISRCKFWGYGSDGTVSANKNSIKIIGETTEKFVQGYFEYDSKKSGGVTISHLRFGNKQIQSQYLLEESDFIALHKKSYIGRFDILEGIKENGKFLINTYWKPEEVFEHLTESMQKTIIEKNIKVYCIDANKIAGEIGLNNKISTIMQAAFFKISQVIDETTAINSMKEHVKKQFEAKGEKIVNMNFTAIDKGINAINEVLITKENCAFVNEMKLIPDNSDEFTKNVIEPIMRHKGDSIPVSQMPLDGRVPISTTKIEKRKVAEEIPRWISENCIQCNTCAMVCPHAAIRAKQIEPDKLNGAPETFNTLKSKTKNNSNLNFKIQIYPEDCVGCGVCVQECPSKEKSLIMSPIEKELRSGEKENQKFFESLPNNITEGVDELSMKGAQFKQPLFEFSGACAGCGETPYIKLVTQMFGDRMIIANATGCSSIYGATFPTVPYCTNDEGKGPAWANSLFEDNAEYGFGMRTALDANRAQLKSNIQKLLETGTTDELRTALQRMLTLWDSVDKEAKDTAKDVLKEIPRALETVYGESKPILEKINELRDYLIEKSLWIIGGDGWAYDIGYGGLDHVLASGKNVNVLVLDTEVYSNTGGQSSKATPRAARAKFAFAGKETPKKNIGAIFMSYGYIYVASVDMGGNKAQVVKAFKEAEEYDGPSIIIAYSPCIAHNFDMRMSEAHEKAAAQSGYWPMYRYDPRLKEQGLNPFQWESKEPTIAFKDYILEETRYKSLETEFPENAKRLYDLAEKDAKDRFKMYKQFLDKEEPKTEQ